jgi:carboxypeptidase Q
MSLRGRLNRCTVSETFRINSDLPTLLSNAKMSMTLTPIHRAVLCAALISCSVTSYAQGNPDSAALARIRSEGFNRSQVMETAHFLTDVYGPRLTGSPLDSAARAWALQRLASWGLSNVTAEPVPFDKASWVNERFYVQVTAPSPFPVVGMATAWSKGTDSLVRTTAVLARVRLASDTIPLVGHLQGKVALISAPFEGTDLAPAPSVRYTRELLDEMQQTGKVWYSLHPNMLVELNRFRREPPVTGVRLTRQGVLEFLRRQGAVAALIGAEGVGGNFAVYDAFPVDIPQVAVAPEHYSRLYRTLESGIPVSIELDIRNRISSSNAKPANILAELHGGSRRDEVVMIGGHFDSWAGGTGATDNAAGAAVMMEVMRILKASGVTLNRTVRLGLWTAEEVDGIGSRYYIDQHLGTAAEPKAEGAKFSAYFNLDWGSGAIRAIDDFKNETVHSVFERWVRMIASDSIQISHVLSMGNDPSDDSAFDSKGFPAFYFHQDPLDYTRGTHHTSQDVYDRLVPENLRHNAVVVASIVYLAANHPELLPRKPLVKK